MKAYQTQLQYLLSIHTAPNGSDAAAARPIQRRFTDEYELHERIGVGTFSTCYRCTQRSTKRDFAVKVIDRALAVRTQRDVAEEIEILWRHGQHPHIVKLYDAFDENKCDLEALASGQQPGDESRTYAFLVMPLLRGGELLDLIASRPKGARYLPEWEARGIMRVLVETVAYLHKSGVSGGQRCRRPEGGPPDCWDFFGIFKVEKGPL